MAYFMMIDETKALAGFLSSDTGAAVSRLTKRQQEVVLLFYVEGLTETEIARKFGVSPSSINTVHRRALQNIRKVF
jgi:RNA polymerase sigma factor (sigma-70 family)